jgi:hypothetical protein
MINPRLLILNEIASIADEACPMECLRSMHHHLRFGS